MHFILGTLQTEYENLLQEINSYKLCTVTSIANLQSGFVISQIILNSLRKPDLFTVVQGFSKANITARWSVILDFMKLHFHLNLSDFLPEEISNDQGVLFVVCKMITNALKSSKSAFPTRVRSKQTPSKSTIYKSYANEEPSLDGLVNLEELKEIIHHWLQDLKLIPPGVLMHEFLYRVRSGLSLYELVKKLDPGFKKVQNFVTKPRSLEDCIKNINFVLRYLRKHTSVHRRFLCSSAAVYEGEPEVVYGLIGDIKDCFVEFSNIRRRSPSPKRNKSVTISVKSKTQPKPKNAAVSISSAAKNSVIEWISSIGLLHKVAFSSKFNKNSLQNGVLLCEVVKKVFQCQISVIPNPKTREDCEENLAQVFSFLQTQLQIEADPTQASEEFIWTVLLQIMNNCPDPKGPSKILDFKNMESKILLWLHTVQLLPKSFTSIFDIVPVVQSGDLLQKIVNRYFIPHKPVQYTQDSLSLIAVCLEVLRNFPKLNQRHTKSVYEICQGDLFSIIGILEDLFVFVTSQQEPFKYSVNYFSYKTEDLSQWLARHNVICGDLTEECLKEFRTGLKICEIIEKACQGRVERIILAPKTAADALFNVRRGLELLYRTRAFPTKYQYYDDLLVNGDGKTIRSFLEDLIRVI